MQDIQQWLEGLTPEELQAAVAEGKATPQQVNEVLQARQRREAAARAAETLPDPTQRKTVGGFGSGQSMGIHTTGQEPGAYDDQGKPRHDDIEWPG